MNLWLSCRGKLHLTTGLNLYIGYSPKSWNRVYIVDYTVQGLFMGLRGLLGDAGSLDYSSHEVFNTTVAFDAVFTLVYLYV